MYIDLTTSYIGIIALIIFILAYAIVMMEEFSHLRKSKPVIISAALIWALIGFYYTKIAGEYSHEVEKAKKPKKHLCVDEAMHNNLYDYDIEKDVINFNS